MSPSLAASLISDAPTSRTIRVVANADEIERLRTIWESFNRNPNSQIDYFNLINEARRARAWIAVVERDGAPEAMLIGRIVDEDFQCRVGYKNVSLGRVRVLHLVYGGNIDCETGAAAESVVTAVERTLATGVAHLATFSHLRTGSDLFRHTLTRPSFLRRDHLTVNQAHWKTDLGIPFSAFVERMSGKHRSWVRRLEKILQRDFPGELAFRCITATDQLSSAMAELESIAAKTYQRQLGAGFRDDDEYRRRFTLESGQGWLRIYILYVRNRPAAFWIGTLYKGTFFSDFTGYDPEFRKYELGTVIFMRMIEQLCAEGTKSVDYGLGDAFYKQRFGTERWEEASVSIFAPTLHGCGLNFARLTIEGPALIARRVLEATQLQQRVKTLWRRWLTKKNPTQPAGTDAS